MTREEAGSDEAFAEYHDLSPEAMVRAEAEFQKRHANSKPMVPEIFSRSAVEGGLRGDIAIGCEDEDDDQVK